MKIGIYDDGTIDRRGGGFTFKNEIINGLKKSRISEQDQIFIFGWTKSSKESYKQGNLEFLCINEPIYLKIIDIMRKKIHQIFKIIFLLSKGEKRRAIINPSINAFSMFSKLRTRIIEKKLISWGADLIIYMEAQEILTFKIPYICISWDLAHLYCPYFPETNFENWELIEKCKSKGLKRAVHIIAGTNKGKEQITSQYCIPKNRISVIPFPTPIYLLSENTSVGKTLPLGFDSKNDFIIYPASYWPHKNHLLLVEAMRILIKEKGFNLNLVFSGSDKGNKRFIQEMVSRYQLNESIYILDFLDRSDLNFLYTKALALVFPSHIGPDNFPPLEGFGMGCPVIASMVEGAEEQLSNAALLFDPFDVEDLVEKIMMMKNDVSMRRTYIDRGLKKARNWTSDMYAQELISLADLYRPYNACYDLKTYRTMFA